jgi:hypothetical protein
MGARQYHFCEQRLHCEQQKSRNKKPHGLKRRSETARAGHRLRWRSGINDYRHV